MALASRHRLGAALLLLPLLGCRAESGAPTTIEFWAMGREGEVVQKLVPAFERRTPGVRVRVQQIPWSAAHEKLLTAYVGGAMPDVFQAGNTWIPELVALKAVGRLDGRIAGSASVRRGDYFRGILDTNVLDGATYGVPWYVDTRLLFYRSDLLRQVGYAQPPATWEAWLEAMTRLKQRPGPTHYAILLPFHEWQVPVILALELNAALLRDDDRYGNFQSPAFRRAFAFYLDLFRRGLAPRGGQAQVANVYQDFARGYFSFLVSGPWNIGEMQQRLPPTLTRDWATAPMPAPDAEHEGVSVAGGASLAIYRASRHPKAAWKWIEYLSEPARQVEFYRLSGDLPARRTAWADPALADNRRAQAFWQQLHHVRATPKIPEWERIASEISRYAEAAIRGDLSADDALARLDHDVDAVLAKRRWMMRGREQGR